MKFKVFHNLQILSLLQEIEDNTAATPLPDVSKDRRASRQFIASSMEGLNRKGRRMSIKPDPVSQKETLMAK